MMQSATNISAQTGNASPIHWANGIASPVDCSISSRPIRLGGLPTGVSRPPTLAPYASISISAKPTRSRVGSNPSMLSPLSMRCSWIRLAMTVRMPSAVGSSMATVAVLETNADSRAVIAPNAMITRIVLLPTPGSARIRNANRSREPVLEHRLGQDEGADEGEDRAGAERREYGVRPVLPTHAEQDQHRRRRACRRPGSGSAR